MNHPFEDFRKDRTYFVKDLIIEELPLELDRVIEIERQDRFQPSFADYVKDRGNDSAFSVTHHTLPVVRLWSSHIDRKGNRENVRASFAFCRKVEKILGFPINTILREREDAVRKAKNLGDSLVKQACEYRQLRLEAKVVTDVLREMSLFDRLMFVVDGYYYLELLFNAKLRRIRKP
jgi:hypothetical protein